MPSVGQQQHECSDGSETSNITCTCTVSEVQLIWMVGPFLIYSTWQFQQVFIHNTVIYNKHGLSWGSFSFNFGSHGVLVQSFMQAVFLWSRGVKSTSILNRVEHRQRVIRRAPTVDMSGSVWVSVPMVYQSGMGEVGSFHLETDPIPRKRLAIPFSGSIYFRGFT